MLCGNRTEGRRIQTGICRSAQLLSLRSGRDFEARAGQPVYRSAALQEQERLGSGVFPKRYEQAHRRQRISGHQQPTGGTGEAAAVHRRYSKTYHRSRIV